MVVPLSRRVPLRWRQTMFAITPAPLWARARALADGETRAQRVASKALHDARTRRARQRLQRTAPAGTDPLRRIVTTREGGVVAAVVDDPRFQVAADANLTLVDRALTAAGVPWVVTAAGAGRTARVAVPTSARAAAMAALTTLAAAGPVRIEPGDLTRGGPFGAPRVSRPSRRREPEVLTVHEPRATAAGALLAGAEAACVVAFWDDGDGGPGADWTAPGPDDRTDELTPQDRTPVTLAVGGVDRPSFPAFTGAHLFDVRFPIDVVYTWVDGSDPEWLQRKDAALAAMTAETSGGSGGGERSAGGERAVLHQLAANASRYASHDELRYSLRSLETYADWVRTVHLVTDGQVPSWLRVDHPRLRVVDHRELFGGTGRLPTFNSHAIESRLHLIEGLSEHYLYLNDDVFFGRAVPPETFFTGSGLSRFFLSRALIGSGVVRPTDAPVTVAAKNNRAVLQQRFDRTVTNKFKHVPHPQRRSVMAELAADFAAEVDRTAATPFRGAADLSVASSLHHHYAYATGRAVPGELRYFYSDIASPQIGSRLRRLARDRDHDVFCLNDHDGDVTGVASRDDLLGRFLRGYFPLPSSFERPTPTAGA